MSRRRLVPVAVVTCVSVVLLLVLTSAPPTTNAATLTTALDMTFPVSYGTPIVPTSEGAQGVQGLNIPRSLIGPQALGHVGTSGHLGPVNGTNPVIFTKTSAVLSLRVWNGTVNSSVAASGQHVSLRNLTFNTYVNGTTTTKGFLNLTDWAGWYLLNVTPSTPGSWIQSITEVYLAAGGTAVTRYLLPASLNSVTVGNGPAGHFGDFFVRLDLSFDADNLTPQVSVALFNSSGGHVLATAVTGNNGTATFLNVYRGPPANFVYMFHINGYESNLSATKFYDYNLSANPGANVQENLSLAPLTRTTGVVTGTAIPANYICCGSVGNWNDSGANPKTTITGGTTYFSLVPTVGGQIRFVNGLVFINSTYARSGGFYNGSLSFSNSTVVFLQPGNVYQFNDSLFINDSRVFGTFARFHDTNTASFKNDGVINFLELNAGRSLGSILSTGFTKGPPSGSITNTKIDNITTGAGSMTLVRDTLTNYSMTNTGRCPLIYVNQSFVYNSSFVCAFGSQSFINDVFDVSDFYQNNGNFTATNSYMNFSVTVAALQQGKRLDLGNAGLPTRTTFTNDYFTIQLNPWLPLSVYKATTSTPAGGFHNNTYFPLANTTNMTRTVWNMTQVPEINVTFQPGIFFGYQDDFEMNYSNAQLLAGGQGFAEQIGGLQFGSSGGSAWSGSWNYSILNFATMFYFESDGNFQFAHDVFPWVYQVFPFAQTQLFGHNHLFNNVILYANDAWRYSYWNTTVIDYVHSYQVAGGGDVGIQDLGGGNPQGSPASQNTGPGWLNLTHDTFWGRPLGTMGVQQSWWVLAGQEYIQSNFSHVVFENSPRYSLGQSSFSPLYGYDVMTGGQKNSFYDDWFLNLTNETAPLGSNSGVGGGASPPYLGAINIVACRFFYAPALPGQTSLTPYGPWLPTQNVTGSPVETDPIINGGLPAYPLVSQMTYEIPEGFGAPTTAKGGTYVFNTSNQQTEPRAYLGYNSFSTGGANNYWTVPKVWSFAVEPDTLVSSSALTVGYGYGLDAGLQPNISYGGHIYGYAAEPTKVRLSADSVSAPALQVAFLGLNSTQTYEADVLTSSGQDQSFQIIANASGVATLWYTPATMSLNATFVLGAPGGAGHPSGGPPSAVRCTGIFGCVIIPLPSPLNTVVVVLLAVGVAILLAGPRGNRALGLLPLIAGLALLFFVG